ncbi:sel-13 [Pristionchus pacificus]|uniref:Sel-13 n=1 Tax=Pristionchus pacificus TaxID=54126 RepID=A0A2A6CHN4_PRIPA|nr:sel-13 [Pristionchus pacificus]|eukprot:PDM77735.1 sel-13 [Pristionchus pacificus]
MSLAHLKLNPAIARETPRGEVMCLVCNMTVKPKIWTAHVVGKTHRSKVEKLKKELSNPKTAITAVKRAQEAAGESTAPVKKAKIADGSELPEDFFAPSGGSMDTQPPPALETPWHRTRQEQNEVLCGTCELLVPFRCNQYFFQIVRERKGLIEGLPQGFFDDKAKDMKVRETAEKDEQMEADYDKLMREIAEQDAEKEAVREREEDADTKQRELDYIDEQMERLKHLNEMEIKRDAILEGRKARSEAAENRARQAGAMEESDDDDGDDDVNFDDWRSMNVLR